MKKYIIILLVTLVAFVASAQDKSYTLKLSDYTRTSTAFSESVDTIAASDTYQLQALANKAEPVKYDISVTLDSISGAPNVTAILSGKVFEGDDLTPIDTITWYGTSDDTTIVFQEHTTALYWRYFDVGLTSTATAQKSWVSAWWTKFWSK